MTSTPPILSICIPTYNRMNYLSSLLTEVLNQLETIKPGLVEVVVSDNASPDGTWEMLKGIQHPAVKVFRNEVNNYTRNFWTSVQHATGQYCWLMGDDDEPTHRAIERVLHYVKGGSDWYILTPELEREEGKRTPVILVGDDAHISWNLADESNVRDWASNCTCMASVGGLLSCLVGRREALLEGFQATESFGCESWFPHVAAFLHSSALSKWGWVRIVTESLVLYRDGNDGVAKINPGKRIMVDLKAWLTFSKMKVNGVDRFPEGPARSEFLAILRRHHKPMQASILMTVAAYSGRDYAWAEAREALLSVGYPIESVELAEWVVKAGVYSEQKRFGGTA